MVISHIVLLIMRNVSGKLVEKIKTHVLDSIKCFEIRAEKVEKYFTAGLATPDHII